MTIATAMLRQFRERNFILSLFGGGVYGFVHRAFLEYFCADDLRRRFRVCIYAPSAPPAAAPATARPRTPADPHPPAAGGTQFPFPTAAARSNA